MSSLTRPLFGAVKISEKVITQPFGEREPAALSVVAQDWLLSDLSLIHAFVTLTDMAEALSGTPPDFPLFHGTIAEFVLSDPFEENSKWIREG